MKPMVQGGDVAPSARRSSRGALVTGLRRVRDWFPWTPLGLLLATGAYGAVRLMAYAELDLVWLVTGYVGLGLVLVSPLVVLLAAGWLKWRGPLPDANEGLVLETGTGF